MIRTYETTFIVNPQAEEAVVDRQVKDIADVITNSGGKILQEDRIGTRRLAYEIKGLSHGHYAGFIFEGNNELLAGLDRFYRLNEQYVRFLTVVFDGDVEKVKVQRATDYFHRDDDRGPVRIAAIAMTARAAAAEEADGAIVMIAATAEIAATVVMADMAAAIAAAAVDTPTMHPKVKLRG